MNTAYLPPHFAVWRQDGALPAEYFASLGDAYAAACAHGVPVNVRCSATGAVWVVGGVS